MTKTPRMRKIPILKKIEIVDDHVRGSKNADIARAHRLAPSTITRILKQKHDILRLRNAKAATKKRCVVNPACRYANINNRVLTWFKELREKNVSISGDQVKTKALEIARSLGEENFKASSGWLETWKKANGLTLRCVSYCFSNNQVCGEGASTPASINDSREKLQRICAQFERENIFNADEAALVVEQSPKRTLARIGETVLGCKQSKECVTVFLVASAAGEKLTPVCIGKSQKPRAFKDKPFPKVEYYAGRKRKAWMTRDLFRDWLLRFDQRMLEEGRKVLLLVDNAQVHKVDCCLRNVTLEFLDPNCTAHLQALDAGIIAAFKKIYFRLVHEKQLGTGQKINYLDVMNFIAQAWTGIHPDVVINCFRHTNTIVPQHTASIEIIDLNLFSEPRVKELDIIACDQVGTCFFIPLQFKDIPVTGSLRFRTMIPITAMLRVPAHVFDVSGPAVQSYGMM